MGLVEKLCGSLQNENGPLAECIKAMVGNLFYKLSVFENINIGRESQDSPNYNTLYGDTLWHWMIVCICSIIVLVLKSISLYNYGREDLLSII